MHVKSGGMGNHAALVYRKFFDIQRERIKSVYLFIFMLLLKKDHSTNEKNCSLWLEGKRKI